MEKLAIFVDAGNMHHAQKKNGWHIDWKRALEYFSENRSLKGAFYFTSMPPNNNPDSLEGYQKFKTFLINIGFKVVDKELRTIKDSKTGKIITKGNLDIEIVFQIMVSHHKWDECIVFGCDSDFAVVYRHLNNIGKQTKVIGIREMTSLGLINEVDEYIDLNDIRNQVEKRR